MIPGPVTGRAAIDPNAASRPQAELAGEDCDAGTSFADLLAAMLAPGAAGAQLQSPSSAPAEAVFERLDAAEIFNETGLFRGAAPLPSADAAPPVAGTPQPLAEAPQRAAPPAEVAPSAPARIHTLAPEADLQAPLSLRGGAAPAAADAGTRAARPVEADSAVISSLRGAVPASRLGYRPVLSLRGQPVAAPSGPPQSGEAAPEAAGGRPGSPRALAVVAQLVAAKAGAAAAQVSVQAVEGGINVTARVDKLSREERDRLRVEIGALLARHGYGPAEILLNGEAWPLPKGEDY